MGGRVANWSRNGHDRKADGGPTLQCQEKGPRCAAPMSDTRGAPGAPILASNPVVSVIVATSRGGEFLRFALDSLRKQSFADFEAVIVDDGSPQPEEIDLLAAALDRVQVIHQQRSGSAISRNVALARARGEFVAFLDDDDLIEPQKLERQVAELRAHPRAVGCHTQFRLIDAAGDSIGIGNASAFDVHTLMRGESRALCATLLVRRSTIDRCGRFSSNFPLAEDLDLLYRLAREGELRFIPDPLYSYRRHESNLTNQVTMSINASMRALELQQNWARMASDEVMRRDVKVGLKNAKRHWIATSQAAALACARHGEWKRALDLGAISFRLDLVGAVTNAARKAIKMLGALKP
jgi:glycosyltransferase involved in cell wall biosynthesis